MNLSELSITRFANGYINHLPTQLQILNIHRLDGDVSGKIVVRLKLSDGKNYYTGFVIDQGVLNLTHADVYAIVCIKKVMMLRDWPGKRVIEILEMELVLQENMSVGEPEPCKFLSTKIITSCTENIISQDTIASSTSQASVFTKEYSNEFCDMLREETRIPIIKLSVQMAKQAVIEGRVIRKSDMLTYSNETGRFFTFDLADLTGEIRCKAFNAVANKFFGQIVKGNVYCLSHFALSNANRKYNHLAHDFEVNMTTDTAINQINDEKYVTVDVVFNFTKISTVTLEDIGKCLDLLVTIKSVGDIDSVFVSKKKSFLDKRVVMVSDNDYCTEIVLWGDMAKTFCGKINQVMAIKDLIVQNFKGQLQFTSTMMTTIRFQD